MKAIGYIYEEYDYDLFVRLPDNRDVYEKRVNKLVASMSEKYICNPIIVNEKMEVIDGQGRFEARKKMGLPIHYIIDHGATIDDCRRMNRYNTNWRMIDYATSFVRNGNENYSRLVDLCKEFKIPIKLALRLGNRETHKNIYSDLTSGTLSKFQTGGLIFSKENADAAKIAMTLSDEMIEALQFDGAITNVFRIAAKIVVETEGYDHEKMLKNCSECRFTYTQMSSLKDQLAEFERIYNRRTHSSKKLYFTDYMRNRGHSVRSYSDILRAQYEDEDVSTLSKADQGEDDA